MRGKKSILLLEDPPDDQRRDKKIVSYSNNIFIPVTNLCRNKCSYCGFRREPGNGAWIMPPEEVLELAERGKKVGCSEALITLGERPEVHEMMRERLDALGYHSTVNYLEDLSRKILNLGLLPHINAGILNEEELNRLSKWSASMGLMLECAVELPVHAQSPGKDPKLRLEMIKKAGELKIPFTTGILLGIGESWKERVKSLLKIRKIQKEYEHIQEIIIQPFVPKKGTPMEDEPTPQRSEILSTLLVAKSIFPDMNIQVPPNLTQGFSDFLLLGANDLGGISTVTPDFINPENPWPNIGKLESKIKEVGLELRERLPIYPEFTKRDGFMSPEVKKVVENLCDRWGYRGE